MMEHTKGPWKYEMRDGDRYITSADGKLSICDTQYYPWISCTESDWHLLAAAPELLDALRKAEAFIEDELSVRKQSFLPEGSPYIDEAQSVLDLVGPAIAKAGGQL